MIRVKKVNVLQRRRRVVADVQTQRVLAIRMVLHCVLFMVVGGLIASVNEYLANAAMNPLLLREYLTRNFVSYSYAILALLPLLIYDSMKLSLRIVGPICRLRDTMRRISRKEKVAPLHFRARDYWQQVPSEFNAMIEQLRDGVAKSNRQMADVPNSDAVDLDVVATLAAH